MKNIEKPEDAKDPLKLNKIVEEKVIESDYGRSAKPFNLFSPSQVGYCKRQMYNRKMDLTKMDRYIQGILHDGTRHHFWHEYNLPQLIEDRGLQTEQRVKTRISIGHKEFDLFVSGFADAVDTEGYVYDHKFTGNTSYVDDEPKKKDRRQVLMYIYALDNVHTGQLEYVQADRQHNSDDQYYHTVEWNPEEFKEMVRNMVEVAEAVKERMGTDRELINPFEKCGCYFCEEEELKEKAVKAIQDRELNPENSEEGEL